ncbi:tape measure protein, partial [Treponema endosymbiont of Eucomonympha sp.]
DDAAQGSSEKFERLAQNFQQITAVREASAANLKRFAKDNVPIYDALSKALGVSKDKLKDMVSAWRKYQKRSRSSPKKAARFSTGTPCWRTRLPGKWTKPKKR